MRHRTIINFALSSTHPQSIFIIINNVIADLHLHISGCFQLEKKERVHLLLYLRSKVTPQTISGLGSSPLNNNNNNNKKLFQLFYFFHRSYTIYSFQLLSVLSLQLTLEPTPPGHFTTLPHSLTSRLFLALSLQLCAYTQFDTSTSFALKLFEVVFLSPL